MDYLELMLKLIENVFGSKLFNLVITILCPLVVIYAASWLIHGIINIWHQLTPIFYNKEQKQLNRRRRRFVDHIESEIRRINRLEEWSDHRFTELEAEVETQGRYIRNSLFNAYTKKG